MEITLLIQSLALITNMWSASWSWGVPQIFEFLWTFFGILMDLSKLGVWGLGVITIMSLNSRGFGINVILGHFRSFN